LRLLLDTHALLWWLAQSRRLSETARAAIADPDNELSVSAASAYEIGYKQAHGRLPPSPEPVARSLRRQGIELLPITFDHAAAAAGLPGPHRDPWDRIIMAHALAERCHVVTIDAVFAAYGIPVLW